MRLWSLVVKGDSGRTAAASRSSVGSPGEGAGRVAVRVISAPWRTTAQGGQTLDSAGGRIESWSPMAEGRPHEGVGSHRTEQQRDVGDRPPEQAHRPPRGALALEPQR